MRGWFSREYEPVETVEPGGSVSFQVPNAGWFWDADVEPERPDGAGHALYGPVEVRGARAGQTLVVRIDEVVPRDWGRTWADGETWVASMRHIAKEGRMYVVGVNSCIRGSDIPADIPGRADLYGGDEDWASRGNTVIVDPYGEILAGPITEQEGILYAEIDTEAVRQSRRQFDVVGHYARPDVFRLAVNERAMTPVVFGETPTAGGAEPFNKANSGQTAK